MSEKKPQLSSINHVFYLMITKNYRTFQYASKYHVLSMFIFYIVLLINFTIVKHLCQYLRLGSKRIQTNPSYDVPKKILYLLNLPLEFSRKKLNTPKKLNCLTKKNGTDRITTVLSILIGLCLIIIFACLINLDEPKQTIGVISIHDKFLENTENPSIVPLLWLNDNDIIWDGGVGCESESVDQGRSYVDKNINIALCFFSRYLSYSGHGGVIYVNGGSYSMNINYSMFYNCVCSGEGGAIYFISPNSFLRMICANSCSASGRHFSQLEASEMNQMEYLSISNCSHTTSGYYPIHVYKGYQRVDNTNCSMNNAGQGSGLLINSPSSFTSSLCTFSNNKASYSICIYFSSSSGTISMSLSNIVHNISPNTLDGVFYAYGAGSRKMIYCIFRNNQNRLFCVVGGSLEVSHSFIFHTPSFSTSTAVSTSNNNSFTNRITYQLQFFNSFHCNADIPLPKRSVEETLRMTYERTIVETPKETAGRTYAECMCTNNLSNWREISFVLAFLYAMIILMIS